MGRLGLFAIVFVAGAAVMTVEIVGTRVIGPVFGVNLFVWSALLAVTLAALALGYYAGGVLVDRRPTRDLIGLVVLAGGLALCLARGLGAPMLELAIALGPRVGPLVSAAVLFAPTLASLGMVGPVAVRLVLVDPKWAGHRVGAVYAVSTAGSLLGTLLVGFVIVPSFDTDDVITGTAVLLIVVGGAALAEGRRTKALAALIVPFLTSFSSKPALPAGIAIVDRAQSLYGSVQVIDDTKRGVRLLRADHSVIGAQFTHDRSAAFAFLHVLEAVYFRTPRPKSALQIGLGIGSVPASLERRGVRVDSVEIDPLVVDFAKRHFGFNPKGTVFVDDARAFLGTTNNRYDVVVHDTFTGGTTPEHLLSLEVVRRIRDLLQPNGVLALNFVGYDAGENAEASRAIARTLRAVFETVKAYRDSPPGADARPLTNLVFFATMGDLSFVIPDDEAVFENRSCKHVLRTFQSWEVLTRVPAGSPITDAKNPLARLQLAVADEHFTAMNELLPLAVWLN